MSTTLKDIDEIFVDIANAINTKDPGSVGECTLRTEYAEKIKNIDGIPSGPGTINPYYISADVHELPEGSDEEDVKVETTVTKDGGVHFDFFLRRGEKGETGPSGKDGKDGKDGEDGAAGPAGPIGPEGPQGDIGEPGRDGVSGYRFEFIYKRVGDDSVHVSKPSNDPEVDCFVPYDEGWYPNTRGVNDDYKVEYVCQREKVESLWGSWSDPAIYAKYNEGGEGNPGGRTIQVYTSSETANPTPAVLAPKSSGVIWDVEKNILVGLSAATGQENLYSWEMNAPSNNKGFIWQSNANFDSAGEILPPYWSTPFRITGDDGRNGTDGTSIEFAYARLSNYTNYSRLVGYIEEERSKGNDVLQREDSVDLPKDINVILEDKFTVEASWTDHPYGVNDTNYLIEVVCSRTVDSITGKWNAWSLPTIWSKWGEDGMDGPGIEYIYLITPEGPDATSKYTGIDIQNNFMPPIEEMINDPSYQEWEYVPNKKWYDKWVEKYPTIPKFEYDWTDEPSDVSDTEPVEWVSIRRAKKIQEETEEGDIITKVIWGPFETPKIWTKYAENGLAYKTSYVFTRDTDSPTTPTGGTFSAPYPTINGTRDDKWTDSIEDGVGSVWMSFRTFRSDELSEDREDWFDVTWSVPRRMTDTANFQTEFTATDLANYPNYKPTSITTFLNKPENNGKTFEEVEQEWRNSENMGWGDAGSAKSPLYMATATCSNGIWTDWTVVRVKGEKGDAGADGTSVNIEGQFLTYNDLLAEWEAYYTALNGNNYEAWETEYKENTVGKTNKFLLPLEQGDGYIVVSAYSNVETDENYEEGMLWVYDGDVTLGMEKSEEAFKLSWIPAGKISGPAGEIYIRYSDNVNGDPMLEVGQVGTYIGFYTGPALDIESQNNPALYTWSKWKGDDGWGYEQVFIATKAYEHCPSVPSDSNPLVDYTPVVDKQKDTFWEEYTAVPDNWLDKPLEPTDTLPYVWYVTRKTGASFGEWRGNDSGYALLYARKYYDGISAWHLELSNDQAIIPVEPDGSIDPDFTDEISTVLSLYAGDDLVEDNVTYTTSLDEIEGAVLKESNKMIFDLSKLDGITEIACIATYQVGEVAKSFTKTLHIKKTSAAYEIVPNRSVVRRDLSTNQIADSDLPIIVEVKRWNGEKWTIDKGKDLFIKYFHTDTSNDEIDSINIHGESIQITKELLSDELDLTKIRLYLTADNTSAGDELCFEEIGVVANGEDGAGQEYVYYRSNSDNAPNIYTPEDHENNSDYQKDEYLPYTQQSGGIQWTDNPTGVTKDFLYEYVSTRKKTNGKWGVFSTPALWAKFGVDGKPGDDMLLVESSNSVTTVMKDYSGFKNSTITTQIVAAKGTDRYYLNNVELGNCIFNDKSIALSIIENLTFTRDESNGWTNVTFDLKIDSDINDEGVLTVVLHTTVDGDVGNNAIYPVYLTINIQNIKDNYVLDVTNDYASIVTNLNGDPITATDYPSTTFKLLKNGWNYLIDSNVGNNLTWDILITDGDEEKYSVSKQSFSNLINELKSQTALPFLLTSYDWESGTTLDFRLNSKTETEGCFITSDTATVTVTAHLGDWSSTKTFTVNKLKDIAAYNLDCDSTINFDYWNKKEHAYLVLYVKEPVTSYSRGRLAVLPLGYRLYLNDYNITSIYNEKEDGNIAGTSVFHPNDFGQVFELGSSTTVELLYNSNWIDVGEELTTDKGEEYIIIDKATIETTYNGEPGENAKYYIIEANCTTISTDGNGNIIYPSNKLIKPVIYEVDGSTKTKLDTLPTGYSIQYQIDNNGYVESDGMSEINISTVVTNFSLQLIHADSDNAKSLHSQYDIVVNKDGKPGIDGQSPVLYIIEPNITELVIDSNDKPVTDNQVLCTVYQQIGETRTDVNELGDFNGELQASIDGGEYVDISSGLSLVEESSGKSLTKKIINLKYVSNNETLVSTSIPVIKQEKGETGSSSPVIYPDGIWDESTTYNGTSKMAPYVAYNTGDEQNPNWEYYIAYGSIKENLNPSNVNNQTDDYDWNNVPSTGRWIKMESYNAIYTDILLANNAKVGSAVFKGKYMYSQFGYDNVSNPSTNYWEFLLNTTDGSENSNPYDAEGDSFFYPNMCLDFVTGEAWFDGGDIHFGNGKAGDAKSDINLGASLVAKADGTGSLGNKAIEWDSTGITKFIPSTKRLSCSSIDEYGNIPLGLSMTIDNNKAVTCIGAVNIDNTAAITFTLGNTGVSIDGGIDGGIDGASACYTYYKQSMEGSGALNNSAIQWKKPGTLSNINILGVPQPIIIAAGKCHSGNNTINANTGNITVEDHTDSTQIKFTVTNDSIAEGSTYYISIAPKSGGQWVNVQISETSIEVGKIKYLLQGWASNNTIATFEADIIVYLVP